MQLAAMGLVLGGAGLSAMSTLEAGDEAAYLGKTADKQLQAEAKAVDNAGAYESREKRKEAARLKASQIAQMNAQGGTMTGSNLTILANTAKEFEADALVISNNYALKATGLRNAGALEKYKGQVARRASRIRATSDLMATAGSMFLMSGASGYKPGGGGAPAGMSRAGAGSPGFSQYGQNFSAKSYK